MIHARLVGNVTLFEACVSGRKGAAHVCRTATAGAGSLCWAEVQFSVGGQLLLQSAPNQLKSEECQDIASVLRKYLTSMTSTL